MSSAVCVIFDCNIYIDVAEALGFDASLAICVISELQVGLYKPKSMLFNAC